MQYAQSYQQIPEHPDFYKSLSPDTSRALTLLDTITDKLADILPEDHVVFGLIEDCANALDP